MTIRRLKIKGSDITVRALELPGGTYHVTTNDWVTVLPNNKMPRLVAPDGTALTAAPATDSEGAQIGYLLTPGTP